MFYFRVVRAKLSRFWMDGPAFWELRPDFSSSQYEPETKMMNLDDSTAEVDKTLGYLFRCFETNCANSSVVVGVAGEKRRYRLFLRDPDPIYSYLPQISFVG